ncbi:MAG TPA: HU family DNA-binding protein [Gaiellales bacterium]|nr:HU family DNA-binding protein [Gaiellales bacterium]
MTKTELIEHVARETGESKAHAQRMIDATLATIEHSLASGEDVAVTGFGRWTVTKRAARTGINPRTGERLRIGASRAPRFAAGSRLKQAVATR